MANDPILPPPPPPPPDGSDRPDDCKIYALLVAVNDYPNARNLKGCVADIDRVEDYLKWRYLVPEDATPNGNSYSLAHLEGYQSLHIERLENSEATYENIIDKFNTVLAKAGRPDKVWFHFSGHGTEAFTAKEFMNLENGMDNCLICHDYALDADGKLTGLLADKEIAQLLNVVAGGENGTPHILVSLDCCHSGSGTRGEEEEIAEAAFTSRKQELDSGHSPRPLESYFGYSAGQGYEPPPSHVVITACTDLQLAGDGAQGGAFTTGLIDALEAAGGSINYADLHAQTRFSVARVREKQTPQFDVIGDTKAYSLFLDGRPDGEPDRYAVTFKDKTGWIVHCGAIHHLPEKSDHPIKLSIFSSGQSDEPLIETTVGAVGPQYSTITVPEGSLDATDTSIYAVFNHIPAPPEYVQLSGEDEYGIDALKRAWSDKASALNIHLLEAGEERPFTLKITADRGSYVLHDLELGRTTNAQYSRERPEEVIQDLITITKWRRTLALEKDRSALKGKIQLQFHIEGGNGLSVTTPADEDVIVLEASQENMIPNRTPGWRIYQLQPEVSITGAPGPLYCYLLMLYEDYEISMYSTEKNFNQADGTGTIEYKKNDIGLSAEDDAFTYRAKLIVTSTELDYHQLLQGGIPGDRFKATETEDPNRGFEDWWVINKTLKIIRKD